MLRLLHIAALAAAVAFPADALAETRVINIYGSTMQPRSVTINVGDRVRWVNRDNANHQIVANRGTFASPVLRQGQAYAFTFRTAGRYGFRDVVGHAGRGTVNVRGAAPAVTLGAAAPILVHGTQTMLTGTISTGEAGQAVTITAQAHGQPAPQRVASVTTGTGGGFAFAVAPTILTTYTATFRSATSQVVTVQVRPKLTLLPLEGRMYARVVSPPQAYAGRSVYLQRLTSVGWLTIARYKLGPLSGRIFTLPRRCGTATYRVYLSVDQAGAGYLDGWSGTQKKRTRRPCTG